MERRKNYDSYDIRLTEKQKELANKIVNTDMYTKADDLNAMLEPIDNFVIASMDEEWEPSDEGLLYEKLRDDIFMYNEYEDYEPKFI